MKLELNTDIKYLKGVGPNRATYLNKIGIKNVYDLLMYFPKSYEDRTKIRKISNFVLGENAVFIARTVDELHVMRMNKGLEIYKQLVKDETGTCMLCWYNKRYLRDTIKPGVVYAISGKPEFSYGDIQISEPICVIGTKPEVLAGIFPIYPLTSGITQNNLLNLIKQVLQNEFEFDEIFKEEFRKKYSLCDINFAIKQIHLPSTLENAERAKKRLIFEELFLLQLALLSIKNSNISEENGIIFEDTDISEFLKLIPFKLTGAQQRVLKEISKDMHSNKVMNRLVQGDVGSGKTIVAAIALYIAVKNGYQGAMMAPTMILATQHYLELKKTFDSLNINIELLTGKTTKKQKEILREKLITGQIDILIGTHALIEDNIEFKNLGLVITDEQHRFGVRQRIKLSGKGKLPDTLVMTATPIPRTLGLMLYGDLDISIIDELPPGRKEIKTYVVPENIEARIDKFIAEQIDEGRQVYVICPLIEESETADLKSAVEVARKYKEETFKNYNVEYLHGKMKNSEKDQIMADFKDRKIDVLISTTVIEVGVNVPNATVMVIENSDRFGLAQLHQLRGRVGRGNYQSYCILKTATKSRDAYEKLKIMEACSSGFEVAEKDLEVRGPGDFFGDRQSGLPEFRIADLLRDVKVLKEAQDIAKKVIEDDPILEKEENKLIKAKIEKDFGERLKNIGT